MKFENPIMNISMFEVENVVTESGQVPQEPQSASEAVAAFIDENNPTGVTITF